MAAEVAASGLSIAEFARQRDVSYDRLRKCCARVQRQKEALPVRVVELVPKPTSLAGQLIVHCPSGHRIELGGIDLRSGLQLIVAAIAEVA